MPLRKYSFLFLVSWAFQQTSSPGDVSVICCSFSLDFGSLWSPTMSPVVFRTHRESYKAYSFTADFECMIYPERRREKLGFFSDVRVLLFKAQRWLITKSAGKFPPAMHIHMFNVQTCIKWSDQGRDAISSLLVGHVCCSWWQPATHWLIKLLNLLLIPLAQMKYNWIRCVTLLFAEGYLTGCYSQVLKFRKIVQRTESPSWILYGVYIVRLGNV